MLYIKTVSKSGGADTLTFFGLHNSTLWANLMVR
jgi:hypothetical protein